MSTEVMASTSTAFEEVAIKVEPKDEPADQREDETQEIEAKPTDEKDKPPPRIQFTCGQCMFSEQCDYKGCEPPFAKKIQFHEECYVMKDPFAPPPGRHTNKSDGEYFIVIGADCSNCGRAICAEATCSIFYVKTFCLTCAFGAIQQFPLEIQTKIRKFIAEKNR